MNSDDNYSEESGREIKFDDYFKVNNNPADDDEIEDSEYSGNAEPKKPETKIIGKEAATP